MRRLLGAALLSAALCAPARADGLKRLESDPSPEASRRLGRLLRETRSRDQRFWLVRALGQRLSEFGDESALEPLLLACADKDPGVRAPALRALEGFRALPKDKVRDRWLGRLDAAAGKGIKDPRPEVRDGARFLREALRNWRHSDGAPVPAFRPSADRDDAGAYALSRALAWLWVLVLPVLAWVWTRLGFPLAARGEDGARLRACWTYLRARPVLLAAGMAGWSVFAGVVAGLGFDLVVLALGQPFFEPLRGWPKDAALMAACLGIPSALIAWAAARDPKRSASIALLEGLPRAAAAAAGMLALLPAEAAYRLLLRKPPARRETEPTLADWLLEAGWFRAAAWTMAASGVEGLGLAPAVQRARAALPVPRRPSLDLFCLDPRFLWLGAGPSLAFFCVMFIHPRPVEWTAPLAAVLAGCAAWALGVLAATAWAAVKTLESAEAASDALEALGRGALPGLAPEKRP